MTIRSSSEEQSYTAEVSTIVTGAFVVSFDPQVSCGDLRFLLFDWITEEKKCQILVEGLSY